MLRRHVYGTQPVLIKSLSAKKLRCMKIRTKSSDSNNSGYGIPLSPSSSGSPTAVKPVGKVVTFQNGSNEKLVGLLLDKNEDVVIICHGYSSSKNSPLVLALAQELASKNLSSLRFDFSGNGESEGVFHFGGYTKEALDLRAAVLFARNDLGRRVVAIAGHSKGGNIVLLYASMFDDVPLIVNIAGRFLMTRGIEERFGAENLAKVERLGQLPQATRTDKGETINFILTKHDLEERRALDMKAVASKITISEVLTVHGTQDTVIPVEDAQAFSQCIRQHQLYVIEGADHNFRAQQHLDAVVKKVSAHITSTL